MRFQRHTLCDSDPVADGKCFSAPRSPSLALIHLSSHHFAVGLHQPWYHVPWHGQLQATCHSLDGFLAPASISTTGFAENGEGWHQDAILECIYTSVALCASQVLYLSGVISSVLKGEVPFYARVSLYTPSLLQDSSTSLGENK